MGFKPFKTGDGTTSAVASFLLLMPRLDWFKQSVIAALSEMAIQGNWWIGGDNDQKQAAEHAAQMVEDIIIMNFNPIPIGKVEAFAGATTPEGWLDCDGSEYNQADYVELFAAIAQVWGGNTGTFFVPDLRDRTLIGAGGAFALADTGGEQDHTLTVAELAAHSHTASAATIIDPGHVHVESLAVPAVSTLGAGVPFPIALPGVGVTAIGFTGITALAAGISSEGGDQPHNNMQPYAAINYIIFAGI